MGMKRTDWLQETKKMRFEEAAGKTADARRSGTIVGSLRENLQALH